jgi:hypothetical protein
MTGCSRESFRVIPAAPPTRWVELKGGHAKQRQANKRQRGKVKRSFTKSDFSEAPPFGRLWYGEPNSVCNAIGYAKFYSRSHY